MCPVNEVIRHLGRSIDPPRQKVLTFEYATLFSCPFPSYSAVYSCLLCPLLLSPNLPAPHLPRHYSLALQDFLYIHFISHTIHPSSSPPFSPSPSSSIWMQLLNRRQTELRLIVLPLAVFCVSDSQGQEDSSVDSPPTELPMGHLILQEKADDWLNVRRGGILAPGLVNCLLTPGESIRIYVCMCKYRH